MTMVAGNLFLLKYWEYPQTVLLKLSLFANLIPVSPLHMFWVFFLLCFLAAVLETGIFLLALSAEHVTPASVGSETTQTLLLDDDTS